MKNKKIQRILTNNVNHYYSTNKLTKYNLVEFIEMKRDYNQKSLNYIRLFSFLYKINY